jgi:hypothetical protein
VYYTTLKIYHREYIRPAPKFYALLCAICWVPALYFFTSVQKSTDITPAESRNLNEGLFTNKMFFKTEFLLKKKQLPSLLFFAEPFCKQVWGKHFSQSSCYWSILDLYFK